MACLGLSRGYAAHCWPRIPAFAEMTVAFCSHEIQFRVAAATTEMLTSRLILLPKEFVNSNASVPQLAQHNSAAALSSNEY
jgi:hypothetical protein